MAYESNDYFLNDEQRRQRERMRQSSMSGNSGRRTGERRIKMPVSVYKARLKVLAASVAVVTSVAVSCVPGAIKSVSDNWTLNKMRNDFHAEYVVPETHPTNDQQHFYYDYKDIAGHLEEYGDFDEAVYFLNNDIGYYQTGQVLKWTPYGSFTDYLDLKGYKNEDDFRDDMREQIIKGIDISKMQDELRRMQDEHSSSADFFVNGSKGGK